MLKDLDVSGSCRRAGAWHALTSERMACSAVPFQLPLPDPRVPKTAHPKCNEQTYPKMCIMFEHTCIDERVLAVGVSRRCIALPSAFTYPTWARWPKMLAS